MAYIYNKKSLKILLRFFNNKIALHYGAFIALSIPLLPVRVRRHFRSPWRPKLCLVGGQKPIILQCTCV